MSGANSPQVGLTRRSFLKTTGALAGAGIVASAVTPSLQAFAADEAAAEPQGEQTFHASCRSNCMQACRLTAHVRDGKLVKITPAEFDIDLYRGCCLRGISYMHRVYDPERIQYPMRRVEGTERGAGEWERITWDEAIEEIAAKLKKIMADYGPRAIAMYTGTGTYGEVNGYTGVINRLAASIGLTKPGGMDDLATGYGLDRLLGSGLMYFGNEMRSVLDSSHIFIWGSNPVYSQPQNWRWIQHAKEAGAKVITVDPAKSASAFKSDAWYHPKVATDGWLALGMANYILEKGLEDHDFIMERTNGCFLVRQSDGMHLHASDMGATIEEGAPNPCYVWDASTDAPALVDEAVEPVLEGTFEYEGEKYDTAFSLLKKELSQYTLAKTAEVCEMDEAEIAALAEEIAAARACSVNIAFGLDRFNNGYNICWAIGILMAVTGNMGKDGAGFTGIWLNTALTLNFAALWAGPDYKGTYDAMPASMYHEVVRDQKWMGQDFPCKAFISYVANPISNWPAQNNWFNEILPNLDFVLAMDTDMTDTCRYADIVLPAASHYEVEDFRKAHNFPYLIYQAKAIEPLYEAKSDLEFACLLGRAMGYTATFPETIDFDFCANALLSGPSAAPFNISLERLRKDGFIPLSVRPDKPNVLGRDRPWSTASGRAQLYTEMPVPRVNYGQDLTATFAREHLVYPGVTAEIGDDTPVASKYPIVFMQEHTRWRTHSSYYNSPILRELDPEPYFKLSAEDAAARGIKNLDVVEVFNDRGRMVCKALVDTALPTGYAHMPKGWQRHQFIEGGYQELCYEKHNEWSVAFSYYDCRVEVVKR